MIRILLHGALGRMGKSIASCISSHPTLTIVAGVDQKVETSSFPITTSLYDCKEEFDVIIDFSNASVVSGVIDYALSVKKPLIIATTGLSNETLDKIKEASKEIAILHSANFSLGISVLKKMLRVAVGPLENGYHMEIIEKHHAMKKDSPSGTALALAATINETCNQPKNLIYGRHSNHDDCSKDDMAIHAVRGGSIPGEHTILFAGLDEVIEIKHTAYSRNIFAQGVLEASKFMADKVVGLYSMDDLV